MEAAELVPDVLDKEPKHILRVEFPSSKGVKLGEKLTIQDVAEQPQVVDWDAEQGKYYTLCFTDPDAPSRDNPTVREWVHWLVVNIPGGSKDISKGETLIEFVPSCPGQGSGIHRYTFVLYEQPSHKDFSNVQKFDKSVEHRVLRRNFSIRKFAQKFSMGEAHAGNFYTTEWDEYVSVIRKQLGLE